MILATIFVTAILILISIAFGYYLGSVRNRQYQSQHEVEENGDY
jgi:uncharacterized membrane protein